uniref:Uncharacterized protein n=1 Tax=Stegastes partitus TaxID=144197 RepID=A0A3B4ZID3_9TELE
MFLVRAVVYLSVCLSVLTSLCQGQRSADSQLPSAPDESILGLTTNELAEALQGLLDEADSRVALSVEKKASVIPLLVCTRLNYGLVNRLISTSVSRLTNRSVSRLKN